jgi:pimeloyl-ACP methyl ester carboxylesterase
VSLHERAVRFGAQGTLIGIVTPPPAGVTPHTAFAFLNAGVVHRVGPNRMYVTAARRLAAQGFLCVRFDLSGLGDSSSRRDATPVDDAVVLETTEVLSTLQREYGVGRFVLAGLCSGAVAAFRAALADERVAGAVLLNPQGFAQSAEWTNYVAARGHARRLWRDKLLSPRSWRQALTGKSDYRRIAVLLRQRIGSAARRDQGVSRIADGLAADFQRLAARGVRFLLACSEGDFGMDYLTEILGPRFARLERLDTLTLPAGDHSLTLGESQLRFFEGVERWASAFRVLAQPATVLGASIGAEQPALVTAREPVV